MAASVFRGLRSASWIDQDSGLVQAVAFYVREGETALSVGTTPKGAVTSLNRNYGVSALSVDVVKGIKDLDVVDDPLPSNADHAKIVGDSLLSDATRDDVATELAGVVGVQRCV